MFSFKRCYSKIRARSAAVCVRRQQSQLSPRVWVSFQHSPTLSHNTLEEAKALFVPLLTGEGSGTLKSRWCSRRQPWGRLVGARGRVEVMLWVPPLPLLTLPSLTSSHKFIPSKFRATKLWESCFGRKAEDLFATNLFRELFFVPLQPAHGPAIAAPLASFKAFLHRSLWRK